ncbi:MAG: hypothetical protein U0441_31950 [Polyangiaceae bacterium]
MRRRLLIALLALGTVGGYASGFASLRHCQSQRREAFEQHVAKVCVDAARESDQSTRQSAPAPAYNGVPVIVQVAPTPQVVQVPQAVPQVVAPQNAAPAAQ